MKYTVHIATSAQRDFSKLTGSVQEALAEKMLLLEDVPRPHGIQKLRGMEAYRIRVGNYRLIFSVHDRTRAVKILDIGHRKDVYR